MSALLIVVAFLAYELLRPRPSGVGPAGVAVAPKVEVPAGADDTMPTLLYAHNLRLRQGPSFRVSIRWIRGQMVRTQAKVHASFDDPDSFVLEIDKGVIRVTIADAVKFLNSGSDVPLKNISITPEGDTLKLHGTVHKIVPLPVELVGQLSPLPDGRVKFGVRKINILKVPLKGLLSGLHVELGDLVHGGGVPGLQIAGNDVIFDTQRLLPPPHIRGQITSLRVVGPEIEVIYGGARNDETRLSQWHNFLKLTGGTLDFAKLTMRRADLTMIDASRAEWFDLDLANYQTQLVSGTIRMTPQAGMEIFMPNLSDKTPVSPAITVDWLKDRSAAVPPDVPVR